MKICAACHKNLPKESYSKKQWKLDQRRCKVCTADNREVQPPQKKDSEDQNTNEIIKALDSMYLKNIDRKISDEELFKLPPPKEDCPICFLLMPSMGSIYMSCCGKVICSGCMHAPVYDNRGNIIAEEKCPFCRVPRPYSDEESIERLKLRVEAGDPEAIFNLGCDYRDGTDGHCQDHIKALELFHRAAEIGYPEAYTSIGYSYDLGIGVEVDKKKANHYYELAAMAGDEDARYNLGLNEAQTGNFDRAIKQLMIAAGSGFSDSLKDIQIMYSNGHATKEDYTRALRSYQAYLSEIKSKQRDEAAAADEDYRYY